MNRRTTVVIAGNGCLSGVTSWADQVRSVLADHPRFDVRSLCVGTEQSAAADLRAASVAEAHAMICRMSPAVVIPNYVWPLFLTGLEPGIRCVGMCHADSVEEYYRPLSWYEPMVAKFIAVSKECKAKLAAHVPRRESDITMLPYGVHVPPELTRTYEVQPLRLIYAGRVTQPQKRVWDFVPLVEHLLRMRVPFVFDIVGHGDEFGPLQHFLRARVPAADVRFHSRLPHHEMAAKWLAHDVFIQVSDFEGTSVSMLEAMAHGAVPVVTAASSGIEGVVIPGENGFVVPVGDMAAMAEAIAQLAASRALLAELGAAAYQSAQAYSLERYVERFCGVLDAAAAMEMRSSDDEPCAIGAAVRPMVAQRHIIREQREALQRVKGRRSG